MQWVRPGADCFLFVLQPQLKLCVLSFKNKTNELLLKLFVFSLCKMEKQKFLFTVLQQQVVDDPCAGKPLQVVLFCFTLLFLSCSVFTCSLSCSVFTCSARNRPLHSVAGAADDLCAGDPLRVVLSYSVFAFSALNRPLHGVDVSEVQVASGDWCAGDLLVALFCFHKLSIEDVDVTSVPTSLPPVASGDLFCLHKLSREDVDVTNVDVTNVSSPSGKW